MFLPSVYSNPALQRADGADLPGGEGPGVRKSEKVEDLVKQTKGEETGVPLWVWGLVAAGSAAAIGAVFLAMTRKRKAA